MSPLLRLVVVLLLYLLPAGLTLNDPSSYWFQPGIFHGVPLGRAPPQSQAPGAIPPYLNYYTYSVHPVAVLPLKRTETNLESNATDAAAPNATQVNETSQLQQGLQLQPDPVIGFLLDKLKELESKLEQSIVNEATSSQVNTEQLLNLTHRLDEQAAMLQQQSEELQSLRNKTEMLETGLERCIADSRAEFNTVNQSLQLQEHQLQLLATTVTSMEADLEKNIQDITVLNITQIDERRQQLEQLQNLQEKVESVDNSLNIMNETQTRQLDQQAGQLSRLEENVTAINTDLEKKTEHLNVLNETQATQVSQEAQLQEQKSELDDQKEQLQEQMNLLTTQSDEMQRILEMVRHMNASQESSTKESTPNNETLVLLANQEIKIKNHSEDLWTLHDELRLIHKYLDSINETQITQELQLDEQAEQLSSFEEKLDKKAERLNILNETQASQGLQLVEQAGQLSRLEENVALINTSLEKKTERLNVLNETQAQQGLQLESQTTQLSRLMENVTSINTDLEKKTEDLNVLKATQAKQELELDGQAGQLSRLEENVTAINADLEKKTEHLNILNETQAKQVNKGLQLEEQMTQLSRLNESVTSINIDLEKKTERLNVLNATQTKQAEDQQLELEQQAVQLQNQRTEQQNHSVQLQSIFHTLELMHSNIQANSEDLNKTQAIQANQGILLKNHSLELRTLHDDILIGNLPKIGNETHILQGNISLQLEQLEEEVREVTNQLKQKASNRTVQEMTIVQQLHAYYIWVLYNSIIYPSMPLLLKKKEVAFSANQRVTDKNIGGQAQTIGE